MTKHKHPTFIIFYKKLLRKSGSLIFTPPGVENRVIKDIAMLSLIYKPS